MKASSEAAIFPVGVYQVVSRGSVFGGGFSLDTGTVGEKGFYTDQRLSNATSCLNLLLRA